MAYTDRDVLGNVSQYHRRVMIEANVVAGQLLIRNAAANTAGEGENPTTTAAADSMGLVSDTVAYSVAQADLVRPREIEFGRYARVVMNPFGLYLFQVSGGATSGTALGSSAPANIITNTAEDTTGLTITAAEVGTVDMSGGLLIGLTGNNAGQRRRATAHTNSTSTAVTVPFRYTIAVGDKFLRFPYSGSAQNVQLTSNFVQANGIIAYGTGAALAVYGVYPNVQDPLNPSCVIEVVSRDSWCNPLS